MTYKDTTLLNVVATVFPNTTTLLRYFYVGRNVRAMCITNCWDESKDDKVDGKDKELNEVIQCELVNNIMRAWDDVVKSPQKNHMLMS